MNDLNNIKVFIKNMLITEKINLIKKTPLDIKVFKKTNQVYYTFKVSIFDTKLNKRRDLLDVDTKDITDKKYQGETDIFNNTEEIYNALVLYAYSNNLINIKLPVNKNTKDQWEECSSDDFSTSLIKYQNMTKIKETLPKEMKERFLKDNHKKTIKELLSDMNEMKKYILDNY